MTTDPVAAAPGFDPGAVGLPWYRRAVRQGLGYFAPSSAFVFVPFFFAQWSPLQTVLVAGSMLLIVVFFLGATLAVEWPETARWLWFAGLMGALLLAGAASGGASRPGYFAAYVTGASTILFAWRQARVVIVAVSLGALGLALLQRDNFGIVMAMMALGIGWGVGSGIEGERIRDALRRAEDRTAVLAVAAERERIGRDLHDILGHSLTTIAVKADLARRLVDRDPAAAASEIEGLAAVARQALGDVRATASGMREVRLATEIAAARSVLGAAGIECRAPSALPSLDDADAELLGYVVREAVTNVVRHSGAHTCTIEAQAGRVAVRDDGRGLRGGLRGNGLTGLARRVEDAGGTLALDSGSGGTTLTATLPHPAAQEGR